MAYATLYRQPPGLEAYSAVVVASIVAAILLFAAVVPHVAAGDITIAPDLHPSGSGAVDSFPRAACLLPCVAACSAR